MPCWRLSGLYGSPWQEVAASNPASVNSFSFSTKVHHFRMRYNNWKDEIVRLSNVARQSQAYSKQVSGRKSHFLTRIFPRNSKNLTKLVFMGDKLERWRNVPVKVLLAKSYIVSKVNCLFYSKECCFCRLGFVPANYVQSDIIEFSPLHEACRRGNLELLEECLENR